MPAGNQAVGAHSSWGTCRKSTRTLSSSATLVRTVHCTPNRHHRRRRWRRSTETPVLLFRLGPLGIWASRKAKCAVRKKIALSSHSRCSSGSPRVTDLVQQRERSAPRTRSQPRSDFARRDFVVLLQIGSLRKPVDLSLASLPLTKPEEHAYPRPHVRAIPDSTWDIAYVYIQGQTSRHGRRLSHLARERERPLRATNRYQSRL